MAKATLSRRMTKQGPPPTPSDGLAKKRKNPASTNGAVKKQRTDTAAPRPNGKANGSGPKNAANSAGKRSTKGDFTAYTKTVPAAKPKKLSVPLEPEGDDEEDLGSGLDDALDSDDDALDGADDSDADDFANALSASEDEDVVASDDDLQKGVWSDDDSDAEEVLNAANIAGLSGQLDRERAEEEAENEAEVAEGALQTNIAADLDLSDEDEDGRPKMNLLAPDLQLLRTRITETVRVLTSFKELHDPTRSRAEYTQALLKDICAYYGYSPFLAEKLFSLFPPQEALAFFDANETPRPIVLRTNTLRTSRRELAHSLINRGVTLEPVGKWSKIGLQVFESQVPLGATPEYLAGHYILQAASSFLPVMALAPQEHERVLDMTAAPGGKSTHLAALVRNTGVIFANDSNKDRSKGLIGNIHRLGVKNTIVCNYSALEFPKVMGGFDRVLLDAPCSGTGVIAKDASVKTNKTESDFLRLPHLQKQLLLAAIDSVDHASKTGGYIVYSTCSVTVEENEQVVQYALNRRPNVKLVETGLIFGKEGFTRYSTKRFHPNMKYTRRYYPHAYNVDGFFVAKLRKTGPTPPTAVRAQGSNVAVASAQDMDDEAGPGDFGEVEDDEEDKVEDVFGGFDDEEDAVLIERALKKQVRRKGLDFRSTESRAVASLTGKAVQVKSGENVEQEKAAEVEAKVEEPTEKSKPVNGEGKKATTKVRSKANGAGKSKPKPR
ncbi:hypothetical protein B0A48_10130 [Cryoendolithus antarcticus]|uniref:Nucleolar protein 2 n=1 Tax=Cryoendolithus antarcticus TaxID=1507870 RepID=A0A1V8SWD7_9PEZI|nr:hypothetical protein B0A48_10130 [Cryoendolithus antarcticus]